MQGPAPDRDAEETTDEDEAMDDDEVMDEAYHELDSDLCNA